MKRLLSLSLCLMMALLSFAYDFEVFNADGKTIYYNITSSSAPYTVAVTYQGTSYSQYSNEYTGHVSIPATVIYSGKTYSVTSIGDHAFYGGRSLTSVYIPNSVKSIGDAAFSGCSLTSVYIPNSVTSIGDAAFSHCRGLTSVYIPNSVTSIGGSAFFECSGLTSVTIPNSVTSIGDYAFRFCSGLTSIVVENGNTKYDSRDNCNAIIETASNTLICGCKTTVIPYGVTSIGDDAFYECGLTSITIPNSVTSIGDHAFHGCSGLTSVTIPNCSTSIDNYAFYGCSSLTSVTIPNCVTSIGDYAFQNCIGLTSIEIPNSVTSIGRGAFLYCSGLTSVTIPNSVTTIGNFAFSGCSLTELVCYAETPPFCDYIILEGVNTSLCTLKVPKGSKDAYRQADGWKEFPNIEEVDVTGIEAVTAEDVSNADITDIYDLNGRRCDALQPGVNIVKMSDGTTRKVIKR
ncbi:MAG: leucine-rich repeat domain-containing protein [Prevotella sp.]|nr:leucine-rich repeat domain-containing protein [Prevotella sp.]